MEGNELKCYDCKNCKITDFIRISEKEGKVVLCCEKGHTVSTDIKIEDCDDYEEKTYIGGSSYFSPSCYRGTELDGAVYRKVED